MNVFRFILLSIVLVGFSGQLLAATINVIGGGCTLRDAIRAANADANRGDCSAGSGFDEIVLPDNTFFQLTSDLPTVTSPLRMKTVSANSSAIIDGDDEYRPMKVSGSNNVFFENITFQNGKLGSNTNNGGAGLLISNSEVTLTNATIRDNTIELGTRTGGAIRVINSTITLENCKFYQNRINSLALPLSPTKGNNLALKNSVAIINNSSFKSYLVIDANWEYLSYFAEKGGGIYMDNSSATLSNSLFTQQLVATGSENGANIHMINNSVANISNSTFFHNSLNAGTPIYVEDSEINLNNVTLFSGGTTRGIRVKNSDVYMSNSYLVDGDEEFIDFCVAYDSQDNPIPFALQLNINNLFPPDQSCAGSNAIYSSRGLIESPADNGGLTATARLKPRINGTTAHTNPAIHAGDINSCETTDQRGVLRGATCDIGAYELNDDADLSIDMSIVTSPPYYTGQLIEYHIEVFNLGPADVYGVDVSISETGLSLDYFQTVQDCAGSSCSISSIANGGSVLIKMFMSVETAFDASVIVEGNTDFSSDPQTANNFDSTGNGSGLVSAADLKLSQSLLTAGPYFIGQTLNYEIEIENLSNTSALNVILTHPILNGLVAVSHSGCNSSTASTCNVVGISGGTTRTINFQATVNGQVIRNSVLVNAFTHDPNLINNSAQNNNNTANDSNLKLSMSLITAPPYYSSQYVQYSILIENFGPDPATNVTLESIDENLLITDGDANCNILPCVIPVINNGASLSITLSGFVAVEPGPFSHTTSVSSNQNDSNQSNNSVTLINTISPSADIQVEVDLIDLGPYFVGDIVQFEAKVWNNGTIPATQVNITFPFTTNLQIMDVTSTNCSNIPCTLSTLEVGFNNQEVMQVSTRIIGVGTFILSTYALANEFDELGSNNNNNASGVATVNPNDLIFENGFD